MRSFLGRCTNPLILIDFAGQNIFESATVDTNILIFEKADNIKQTRACIATSECRNNMSEYIQQNQTVMSFDGDESWVIMSSLELSIKRKIEAVGVPLKEWDIKIYRGVLTGFNEAFIISGQKKDELIAADPKSAEIIRPILRGKDIKRYSYSFADLWLITTHNGIKEKKINRIDINDYPAVKAHLDRYYDKLRVRADKGDTPYNLRNCVYMDDFSKQKIIWGELSDKPKFAFDRKGEFIVANTIFPNDRKTPRVSFIHIKFKIIGVLFFQNSYNKWSGYNKVAKIQNRALAYSEN